ncbi:helix-turn-helix transcriptional regulator [Chamaesiphon sp. VAR_48_metabat_403]|uniref:helix-turn-helix domain-containing protein n=1 Tax=Chamaesiphon sp. VAR_48_metabat_403 TaxID=2964700 RepID=UPI00286E4862|nr:helix-turn-helix transcriptional regulator [Chamaesiphon sp. VAR_48_metabat_403]
MSNGGKRLNELIRRRGFRLGAVAEAIGVNQNTMTRWTGNAPIEKLIKISEFCQIDIIEIIECFRPDKPTDLEDSSDQN